MLDPRKLRELLEVAGGPLVAVGTIVGSVTAGFKWLTPIFADYMDREIAAPLAVLVPLLAAGVSIWAAYRALAKKSILRRRERFDLRVREQGDLLGREVDIANLEALMDNASLLLVDGESGSGKSSLIAFGLIPALDQLNLPILVSDYAGDWEIGLARRIFDAAWNSLTPDERTKIGFGERPAIGTVNADTAKIILESIGTRLGRMPILILDQFDDYQLASREQFLGQQRDWIKPPDLVQLNRTWAGIQDLLREEKVRILIVTRSDASAGLHSIRLTDRTCSFTVNPLKGEWLPQWLEQVTADDGKGEVVANPDAGWTDLKKQLERDLTPQGTALGAVLPQQVRIVFLGLRKLPSLDLAEYRRAASGAGVEALYIRGAIASTASESGLSESDVRAVLSAFIERAEGRSLKTKVLSFADLASSVRDPTGLEKALNCLKRDEVVREKPAAGNDERRWQLDHDYIARAIVAEYKAANVLSLLLQDGADAWHAAGGSLRQRYRSLLPVSAQAKLAWARVRSRGRFTYRPYRIYAFLSTLRALPILLLLSTAGYLWREATIRTEASQIVDGLNENSFKGEAALVTLWEASSAVRSRAVNQLLDSPGRLRDVGTDWTRAYISIEPGSASDLRWRLISRLDRKNIDPDTQQSLIHALGSVDHELDTQGAADIAKDLRSRLDRKDIDPNTQQSLIRALGSVSSQLNAQDAANVAKDLRSRLDRKGIDPNTQQALIDALGNVGNKLDAQGAADVAKDLSSRLDREDIDPNTRQSLIRALGSVGGKLDAQGAADVAKELVGRLDRINIDLNTRQPLIYALGSVGSKLDAEGAADVAKDLWSMLDRIDIAPNARQSLIRALGSVGDKLDAQDAADATKELVRRLDRIDIDLNTQQSLIRALGSVGSKLNAQGAADVANDLRSRLDRKDIDPNTKRSLIYALGNVGDKLDAKGAADVAKDLRSRLDRKDIDRYTQRSLTYVLVRVSSQLDAQGAADVAKDLRSRLDRIDIDPYTQQSLIYALGNVGGKLDTQGATDVAKDLWSRLDRKGIDPNTQQALTDALVSFAAISGAHPTKLEISTVRAALGSIAWPLRDYSQSPAWQRLESISGEKFDHNISRVLRWAQACCNLSPSDARPPFTD